MVLGRNAITVKEGGVVAFVGLTSLTTGSGA